MKIIIYNQLLIIPLMLLVACNFSKTNDAGRTKPNVVIIFLDDSGYADFSPYNQDGVPTPNVQKLADEGVVYKNFYVPQAICSASRAALMTGSYPGRTKVFGAHGPKERGLDTIYPTMGEIFSKANYKTALFGKWHCGDQPDTRPQARGFGETCGLMYSNDMWKYHPENPEKWGKYPLQFWENGIVTIEKLDSADQKMLTHWYTEHAVDFINKNKDNPFLLYIPHSMPHVPIFCSDEYEGKSGLGLYADVLMELDWSVGQINRAIKETGLEENTIVVFTSDNGPWISYGNHAGTTPFREAKATSFDGGIHSACIIKYPQALKPGQKSDKTFFSIDLLPTLCHLTNVPLPDKPIDGENVWELISGQPGAQNPHEYYAFSCQSNFEGIISADGRWKLHLPHNYRSLMYAGKDGRPGKYKQENIGLSLFDIENDPMETTNVIEQYPKVAEKLQKYAKMHRTKFYSE